MGRTALHISLKNQQIIATHLKNIGHLLFSRTKLTKQEEFTK